MTRLISIIIFFQVNYVVYSQGQDSVKCWCPEDKLKWIDFKGDPPDNESGWNLYATTVYEFIPEVNRRSDVLTYDVRLVFKKYQSWAKDTSLNLLAHEQLHFDIAELFARRLRKKINEISKVVPSPSHQLFFEEIEKIYNQNFEMQRKYDVETAHGIIKEEQAKWEERIKNELTNLKSYRSKTKDCN